MSFVELILNRSGQSRTVNPLDRAVSAVERIRDRVVAGVESRFSRSPSQTSSEDIAKLEQTRAMIATEVQKTPVRSAIKHNIIEAAKNSAPAAIVGAGARIALSTGLSLQTLAVAAGASAVSRGVREATYTIRKGAFGETSKLITRHEERATLTNFDGSERVVHTAIRAKQDEFAQTRVGKIVNAMLHGGEMKIAQFAYGKHRHAKALVNAQYQDIHTLSDKQLIELREHAVMARITHGTAKNVYEIRQLAKSTYQSVNQELATRGISRHEAHERQLKIYRKDVRVGAAINITGQAGYAAMKAIPKTIGTFFITDAFLKAIHVDTSARHNPLEGLENTRLGRFVENIISPKSVADAEEIPTHVSKVVRSVSNVTPDVVTSHNISYEVTGDTNKILSHSAVLSQDEPPFVRPGATIGTDAKGYQLEVEADIKQHGIPRVLGDTRTPDTTLASDALTDTGTPPVSVSGGDSVVVISSPVEYILHANLTQSLFDDGIVGKSAKDAGLSAVEYYGTPGSAFEVISEMRKIQGILSDDAIAKFDAELASNPTWSFGRLYRTYPDLFVYANKLKNGSRIVFADGFTGDPSGIPSTISTDGYTSVTIDTDTSLSTFLSRSGMLGKVGEPRDIFSRAGSGKIFVDRVMVPNSAMIRDRESYDALLGAVATNPDASTGELYRRFPGAFRELDRMTKGSAFAFADPSHAETGRVTTGTVTSLVSDSAHIVSPEIDVPDDALPNEINEMQDLSQFQDTLHPGAGNTITYSVVDPLSHREVGVVHTDNLVYSPASGTYTPLGTDPTDIACGQIGDDVVCKAHSGTFIDPTNTGIPIPTDTEGVYKYVAPGVVESTRAAFQQYYETSTPDSSGVSLTGVPQNIARWPFASENFTKGPAQIQYALDHNTSTMTVTVNSTPIYYKADGGVFYTSDPLKPDMTLQEYVHALGIENTLKDGKYLVVSTCAHHYWKAFEFAKATLSDNLDTLTNEEKSALEVIARGSSAQKEIEQSIAVIRTYFARQSDAKMLEKFNEFLKVARTAEAQQSGTIVSFYKEVENVRSPRDLTDVE